MNIIRNYLPLFALLFFISFSISSQENTYSLLVALKKGTSPEAMIKFKALNNRFNSISMRSLGSSDKSTEEQSILTSRVIRLKFLTTTDKIVVKSEYEKSNLFKFVELDHASKGNIVPNDPFFSENQYYHLNNGYDGVVGVEGKADADMDTDLAWDITTGNENVVLGVFDSGLRLDHEEFVGRVWVNEDEIPGNGIDDDNNGYIDDINGWDFVNDDNDPSDDNRHGTVVAGIAAATGNNGVGIAGMDWKCKIMVLKVLDNNIDGLISDEIEAIFYAVDNGIHIGNMSFGGLERLDSFQEAVEYAESKGVLLVAATGNEGEEIAQFPAAYSSVMAVGASHPDDTRVTVATTRGNFGSNYGDHIDVLAPGSGIFSSRIVRSNAYGFFGGTSFSSPMVAGLACLIKGLDLTKTPQEIRAIIQNSAEDEIGDPKEDTEGFDKFYGFGRINAHKALLLAQSNFNLNAEFNVSKNFICKDETVTFTNSSSENATSLKWTFGEGASPATAVGNGPHNVTYTSKGFKSVILEVKNSETRDAEVKREFIGVGTGFLENISGPRLVGINQTARYSVAPLEGIEEYIWSIPSGATIISGELTNTIEVKFDNQAGNEEISVLIINECGEEEFTDILIEISTTLSTKENDLSSSQITVFPNPSSKGLFYLSNSQKYSVYDVRGRILLKGESSLIDLGNYSGNLFFLKIDEKVIKLLR